MISAINEMMFEARTYLVWRKTIEIRHITDRDLWRNAFQHVRDTIQRLSLNATGAMTALFFRWDESIGETDLAIGIPIDPADSLDTPELSFIHVSSAKASHLSVQGDYMQLYPAHGQLKKYLNDRQIPSTLTIEEYTVMNATDPTAWVTNLYYLHA